MTRQEIMQDMVVTVGVIPTCLRELPDKELEGEWAEFKRLGFSPEAFCYKAEASGNASALENIPSLRLWPGV